MQPIWNAHLRFCYKHWIRSFTYGSTTLQNITQIRNMMPYLMKLIVNHGQEKIISIFYSLRFLLKSVANPKTFQALYYPISDTNFESQSCMPYKESYWLTRGTMRWFSNNYAHNDAIPREPDVSSFYASIARLMDCNRPLESEGFDVLMYCRTKCS